MKDWRVLIGLEYEWRLFRFYRKRINRKIQKGATLTSPVLCKLSKKMDKHGILVSQLKRSYENQTGKIVVFYY